MNALVKKLLRGSYLPCYVLSKKPLIFFAYDTDFLKNVTGFAAALTPYKQAHLYMQLGWQHETTKVVEPFVICIKDALKQIPQLKITVLANSTAEVEALGAALPPGMVVLCHQNAFLDENKYHIIPQVEKRFDALYIARISPFKRHRLAAQVKNLALIGSYSDTEQQYAEEVLDDLEYVYYEPKVAGGKIYKVINHARCGLCLSAEEGAMFVSAEYLLCGIPIVNTANIGGRDLLFPDFAVKNVADLPEDVAEAVAEWVDNVPNAAEIRAAFLKNCTIHRQQMQQMLDADFAASHAEDSSIPAVFTGKLPHKLGIRTTLMPWQRYNHTL